MKTVNNIYSYKIKENIKKMCQGEPIGACMLVAIMGPPEIKDIIKKAYQLSFLYNVDNGQCVKVLWEYKYFEALCYCLDNSIIKHKQCKN